MKVRLLVRDLVADNGTTPETPQAAAFGAIYIRVDEQGAGARATRAQSRHYDYVRFSMMTTSGFRATSASISRRSMPTPRSRQFRTGHLHRSGTAAARPPFLPMRRPGDPENF
jgi:hypothetical protein